METATNYDAYLSKRAKNRKIIMAVISAVVLVLAAAIMTLSFVSVNNRPQFISNPTEVMIYSSQINNGNKRIQNDEAHAKEYQNFMTEFDDCFKMSLLSSLFSNNFGNYEPNEAPAGYLEEYKTIDNIKGQLGEHYVQFSYATPQTVKEKNGKPFISGWRPGNELSFQEVFFSLSSENKMTDVTFYIPVNGNSEKGKTISTVTIKANTYHLYKSLNLD